MSYKIQYSPETSGLYPQPVTRKPIRLKYWVCTMLVVAAALWMRFYGVPDFLIPGDAEITKAAASVMIGEIKSGVALRDAVTTFCEIILDGAGVTF